MRTLVRCRADEVTADEAKLAASFEKATIAIVNSITDTQLAALIAAGDGKGVVGAFNFPMWEQWASEFADDILGKQWAKGWAAGADGLIEIPGDLTLLARIYARKVSGKLIKDGLVDFPAFRRSITDSIGFGWSIDHTVAVIRGQIGLNTRDAAALNRFTAGMVADGKVTDEQVTSRTAAYHQRLLRARARNIARTEVMTASNMGRLAGYSRAQELGVLGQTALKEWVTAHDDRLCSLCAPMDGQQVSLTEAFSHGGQNPPRHPSCRCTIVIADLGLRSVPAPPARRRYTVDDPDVVDTARRWGVSPDEVLTARRDVAGVKRLIANDAAQAQREAFAVLDVAGALRVKRPPRVKGKGGEYDWMEQLSTEEKTRLSRRWFSDDIAYAPDLIADSFGVDVDEAMEKWLWASRQIEAAGAIRRGKLPSARAYSDQIDPQGFARTHQYDVTKVLGAKSELDAAGYIAQHNRSMVADDAYRMLGPSARPVHGPSPFQMGYQAWEGELLDLDYEIRTGTATRAQEARYRELLPWDLDDPEASMEECYARIVYTARLSGEEVADHARIPWAD